nr:ribosomal protein S3 [Blastocystis sp. subtype 2]APC25026.1 ribosomal protein S3 [Blastocystis sp. subtype 2]
MSQKVSPILFNNIIFNNSKWFNKTNKKYALNEDLQIREIINILFKNNNNVQYLFIDKIVIYKYYSKIKIYIYYFCNFNYFKKNLILQNKNYFNIFLLYYKYLEILNIKKVEILKILASLKYKYSNIIIYYKNINYKYNSVLNSIKVFNKKKINTNLINYTNNLFTYKYYNNNNFFKLESIKNTSKNILKKNKYITKKYNKFAKFYLNLKYFKTIRFILYNLCYNHYFLNKITAASLINVIYYELEKLDNASKSYNFLFYNIFNLIRNQLSLYLKDDNCKIKGLRIQVKGRYFLTKRKRVFIFNLGDLNVNNINSYKDYYCLHLVKSTGTSSIKIWLNYKN